VTYRKIWANKSDSSYLRRDIKVFYRHLSVGSCIGSCDGMSNNS